MEARKIAFELRNTFARMLSNTLTNGVLRTFTEAFSNVGPSNFSNGPVAAVDYGLVVSAYSLLQAEMDMAAEKTVKWLLQAECTGGELEKAILECVDWPSGDDLQAVLLLPALNHSSVVFTHAQCEEINGEAMRLVAMLQDTHDWLRRWPPWPRFQGEGEIKSKGEDSKGEKKRANKRPRSVNDEAGREEERSRFLLISTCTPLTSLPQSHLCTSTPKIGQSTAS